MMDCSTANNSDSSESLPVINETPTVTPYPARPDGTSAEGFWARFLHCNFCDTLAAGAGRLQQVGTSSTSRHIAMHQPFAVTAASNARRGCSGSALRAKRANEQRVSRCAGRGCEQTSKASKGWAGTLLALLAVVQANLG